MSTVNMTMAEKKKAELEAKKAQAQIEKAAKKAVSGGRVSSWTRKSVAIDDEIIEAMETVCKKERKLFSQLAREFFIQGLAKKGIKFE